jgi:hypothetical protein
MLQYQNARPSPYALKFIMPLFLAILVLFFGSVPARANLVIIPTFDSTITSDANAAIIENTISNVISYLQASFSDSVTVTITFVKVTSGLGSSSTYYAQSLSYASIRAKLAANATTVNDSIALAHLPNSASNPVNGSTTMELTLPNARALGFSGSNYNPPAGQTDSEIDLNISLMNLTRTSINGSKYDLYAVAAHEIDEVLGLSSSLDGLNNGHAAPTGDVDSLDLFRYDQSGNRSFNTVSSSQAWLSLDGTNRLVRFNQSASGDFHDWYSPGSQTPRIQDAFGTQGATPDFNVELIALDVIGYHYLVPSLAIAKAGTGKETVSWSPSTPGFFLQESTNLLSTNWLNSASTTNNPVPVTNTSAFEVYRVYHP